MRNQQHKPAGLAAFTKHRDGWVRWYKGKVRFVCGKKTPLSEVEDRWIDLKRALDKQVPRSRLLPGAVPLRVVASAFLERQETRMRTGLPRRLSPHTYKDYAAVLDMLRLAWGADCDMTELGPPDFQKVYNRMKGQAHSTIARTVAYVRAFIRYAKSADLIPALPSFGPDFVKPPAQAHRDHRLSAAKSYTPAELTMLWNAATDEEKCWMGLGLNCAFDNSDVATLTRDVVDLNAGVIDFRRRKVGRVRRVCPLHADVLKLLRAYVRPAAADPADEGRFFLTANGLPLVRIQPTRKDALKLGEVDALSLRWKRLLSRSEVRPPIIIKQTKGVRKETHPKGDGRGFRGLRTTFANLAPFGFRDEVEIVMGHAHGSVLLDNYLETVGHARLKKLITAVWKAAFTTAGSKGAKRRKHAR